MYHVWNYDFIYDRTKDGRPLKILSVIDEYSRECLILKVARRLRSSEVINALNELFLQRGMLQHISRDNGSEFLAQQVRMWLNIFEVKPLYIEPGSPLENRYVESFHGKFRDELLSLEQFDNRWEAKVLIE
jgi:transposase InsO family protein